jgi:hypothetical protein
MGYIVRWLRPPDYPLRPLFPEAVWVSNYEKASALKSELQAGGNRSITITEVNDQNGELIES